MIDRIAQTYTLPWLQFANKSTKQVDPKICTEVVNQTFFPINAQTIYWHRLAQAVKQAKIL